jgi:hypothetical protein
VPPALRSTSTGQATNYLRILTSSALCSPPPPTGPLSAPFHLWRYLGIRDRLRGRYAGILCGSACIVSSPYGLNGLSAGSLLRQVELVTTASASGSGSLCGKLETLTLLEN